MNDLDDEKFAIQLRREFLMEAGDLLQQSEDVFLRLERTPEDNSLIDRVFRTVHTIKGSAGVAGFKAFAAFAHVVETLLGRIRDGEISTSAAAIDALLAGVDTLNKFVVALKADPDATVDVVASQTTIENLLNRKEEETVTPAFRVKPKILIVDDEEQLRDIVVQFLSSIDADFLMAANGLEALNVWHANPDIDLIITDQIMPVMSGHEFLNRVREDSKDVTIIVISGGMARDAALSYLKLNVYDFLPKPIDADALLLQANRALRLSTYHRALVELSRLVIRSYMTTRRVVSLVESRLPDLQDPAVARFSDYLEQIGMLVLQTLESPQIPTQKKTGS